MTDFELNFYTLPLILNSMFLRCVRFWIQFFTLREILNRILIQNVRFWTPLIYILSEFELNFCCTVTDFELIFFTMRQLFNSIFRPKVRKIHYVVPALPQDGWNNKPVKWELCKWLCHVKAWFHFDKWQAFDPVRRPEIHT